MRPSLLRRVPMRPFLIFMLSACVLFPGVGRAQVSPVSVRVEQVVKSDTEKFAHIQKRSLKIAITNASSEDKNALRVKYFFFGKDAGESDMLLLEKGDRTANVPAHQTVIVETPTISRKHVEEHYDTKKSGQRGAKISKKVEASGQRIVGYGTQIFQGDKLLAEYFSEPSLKAKVAPKQ